MADLDQQLRSYFDALANEVIEQSTSSARPTRSSRPTWRRPLLAIAVVVGLVAVGTAVLVAIDEDAAKDSVNVTSPQPSNAPTSTTPSRPDLIAGEWRTLPSTLRTQSELSPFATMLDRDHVLVLFLESGGGDVTGEIIDLSENTATPIAQSPLNWRAHPLVGWTGTEVVVAGGSNGPGLNIAGAAYNPASDTWRQIADPPGYTPNRSENQASGPGVWTGRELISWQSRLAYNPTTDTWRRIAAPPLQQRMDETVVATPEGVIVWGGCDNVAVPNCDDAEEVPLTDGAIYDPDSDRWTMMPPGPLSGGVGAVSVWGSESGAIIVIPEPADTTKSSAAAFDPRTMTWRPVPDLPRGAPGRATALVWTGSHAVLWGGYARDISSPEVDRGFALDPAAGTWSEIEAGGGARRGHTAVWTPRGLVVVGGSAAAPALSAPNTSELGTAP